MTRPSILARCSEGRGHHCHWLFNGTLLRYVCTRCEPEHTPRMAVPGWQMRLGNPATTTMTRKDQTA